jgi:hypothetical protein
MCPTNIKLDIKETIHFFLKKFNHVIKIKQIVILFNYLNASGINISGAKK